MKHYLIIFLLLWIKISFSQTQLVIEVKTDNHPEETKWVLFGDDDQVVKTRDQFSKEVIHRDTVLLEDNKCYYWTLFDSYGEGLSSADGGYFKLFVDGSLKAQSTNPDFGDSISVYNLGKGCYNNDVKLLSIGMLPYLSNDTLSIDAIILNSGTETLTSLKLKCSVNDDNLNELLVENLNIKVGESARVSYPQKYFFSKAGDVLISIEVTESNGSPCLSGMKSAAMACTVVDGFYRHNIIEDFMSYECGPCAEAAEKLDAGLHPFSGLQTLIKYMVWSFADKKYFPKVQELQDFYYVQGIPHIRLNGEKINYSTFSETIYLDYIGFASPIRLSVEAEMIGDSLFAKFGILSKEDLNGDYVLRVLPIEKECFDVSIRYTNKEPFHNIVYDIFNGIDGIPVSKLTKDEELFLNFSTKITGYPFESGSLSDMGIVAYLMDLSSQEVLQSVESTMYYKPKETKMWWSLENEITNVDTMDLNLAFYSNRHLFKGDGFKLKNPTQHILFKYNDKDGDDVKFSAVISAGNDTITIKPESGWDLNTKYYVSVYNIGTLDGEVIENQELVFTTKKASSVNDGLDGDMVVFPNPFEDKIYLTVNESDNIEVVSIDGKLIMKAAVTKGKNLIDFSSIEKGVYLLRLNSNGNAIKVFRQ